jgi:hypothetical protein
VLNAHVNPVVMKVMTMLLAVLILRNLS